MITIISVQTITIIVSFFVIFQWLSNSLNKRIDSLENNSNKRIDSLENNSNKRIDDLKELFRSELKAELAPINSKLNNHITDTTKDIKVLTGRVDNIEKDLKTLNSEMKNLNAKTTGLDVKMKGLDAKMDMVLKELKRS